MTRPFTRRGRERQAALAGDFPDTGETITEILERARPADWDGTTRPFEGASATGLPDDAVADAFAGVVAIKERGRDTEPLARLRARGQQPDMFPALPAPPPAPAAQDPRDTGPMQRMPRMARVRQRPRPARDPDCAIFAWSRLIEQHVMLCGTCPPGRRSRYADPLAWHMPFGFESLRVSARVMGWRTDAFGRWACPACQMTERYHAPAAVVHWHPEVERRQAAGEHVSPFGHMMAVAIREHDLIQDVHAAAGRYRHAGGAS